MGMRFSKVILVLAALVLVMAGLAFSADSKVRVIVAKANIRLKPDIQSTVVTGIPLGAVLDVIKKEGAWYQVKLPPDERAIVITGYLHESTVEAIEEVDRPAEPERKPEAPQAALKLVEPEQDLPNDAGYLKWKEDYGRAESSFKSWKKYETIGMLGVVGGCAAGIALPLLFMSSSEGALVPLIAAGGAAVGGGILWLYAHGRRSSAKENMDLLMNEGRIKKYFSAWIDPHRNCYAVSFSISF
jgi:hypothetical protein